MNTILNSLSKRVALRGLILAAGVLGLILQPPAAFAGNVIPPGTVTEWGYTASSSTPVTIHFPPGVRALAIAAGGFHDVAIASDGGYTWRNSLLPPDKVVSPPTVTTVRAVAAGMGHSLALTDDGLYAWGNNGNGELGNGSTIDSAVPVKVIFPPTVTSVSAIAAGAYHSLAITSDGLYAWGDNNGAQLGDGTRLDRILPVKVFFPPAVTTLVAVSGGGFHSLAITSDGVYAWGNNTFGQLGDGTTTGRLRPTKVVFPRRATPTTVTAIAGGFWHSLAIGDGSVFGWGYNGNGELGDGTGVAQMIPVKTVFPKKTVVIATAIAAGSMHSLAATDQGLFAWGNNSNGQLGMTGGNRYTATKVTAESNVIAVGAGYYHSLALH